MQRSSLIIFAGGYVLVGACADPECPPDMVKIGTVCHPRVQRDAGTIVDEAGDLDDGGRSRSVDARGDAGLGAPDSSSGEVATRDASASSIDAASNQPVAPSQPPADGGQPEQIGNAAAGADVGSPSGRDTRSTAEPGAAMACVSSAEVCDGKDNDCDGKIDEDKQAWYCDNDGDGFAANASGRMDTCDAPPVTTSCMAWTTTAPLGTETQDCDDTTALRFPGAGFGLASSSSGDLSCDGLTETRLEFVASSVRQFSSMTPLNICMHTELFGGNAGGECDCWFSTALGGGFVGFMDGAAQFVERDAGSSSSQYVGRPYFANTFPCAEEQGDVIFLSRAVTSSSGECTGADGLIAARQLCR